jgi:hypothetical protein
MGVSVHFFRLQRYYNSAEGTNERKRLRINSQAGIKKKKGNTLTAKKKGRKDTSGSISGYFHKKVYG